MLHILVKGDYNKNLELINLELINLELMYKYLTVLFSIQEKKIQVNKGSSA